MPSPRVFDEPNDPDDAISEVVMGFLVGMAVVVTLLLFLAALVLFASGLIYGVFGGGVVRFTFGKENENAPPVLLNMVKFDFGFKVVLVFAFKPLLNVDETSGFVILLILLILLIFHKSSTDSLKWLADELSMVSLKALEELKAAKYTIVK